MLVLGCELLLCSCSCRGCNGRLCAVIPPAAHTRNAGGVPRAGRRLRERALRVGASGMGAPTAVESQADVDEEEEEDEHGRAPTDKER